MFTHIFLTYTKNIVAKVGENGWNEGFDGYRYRDFYYVTPWYHPTSGKNTTSVVGVSSGL
jgi:hypothetical protein